MGRVLDVYKIPYNKELPVICMDESPKQLIKETRTTIKMRQGCEAKEDFEYERCGVANIFLASEPLTGKRYVEVTETKSKNGLDNLGTHKPSALYEVYEPKEAKRIWDRFDFVYTPKHVSWLNMAEIELKCFDGTMFKSPNRQYGNYATGSVSMAKAQK